MSNSNLNAICPYFAMFPLDYPLNIIEKYRCKSILDPFCGRGTTNMAARLKGAYSVGIDSSNVAYAISSAKMVDTTPSQIMKTYEEITSEDADIAIPEGEFWDMMYDPTVLKTICKIRENLQKNCDTPERIALRGIMLGALHGPLKKNGSSYLSNQFPRTFASKPAYSVKYWKQHNLINPPIVDVKQTVFDRSQRYYRDSAGEVNGFILKGDSTEEYTFNRIHSADPKALFDTVITSPPYHGMNTYIPDQWIRNWFLGGPDTVEYTTRGQSSGRISLFIEQLKSVWKNCHNVCNPKARMFVRFGEIGNKQIDPEELISKTFDSTGWIVESIQGAGIPKKGRRSCEHFLKNNLNDYHEIDVVTVLSPND